MKTLFVTAALVLAASSAVAQPVVDRAQRAPSPEVTFAVEDAPLPTPALPTVPPSLLSQVSALGLVVTNTQECFTEHGERSEHIAEPGCPGRFAAIQRGGVAGAHAIGAMLDRDFQGTGIDYANVGDGEWIVRPRLIRLMTAAGGSVAATYLVRYVSRALDTGPTLDTQTAVAALATLATLAGEDLTRVGPWEDREVAHRDVARMTAAVQRWLRWHRDTAGLPRAQQLDLARRHNVAALRSSDAAERWAAIERLMPTQRAAAEASLREMMQWSGERSEMRSYVFRWARRQHIALRAR